MPELPEVETTKQGILPHIQDQIISHIVVRCLKLRFPISEKIKNLSNQTVLAVKRRAKYLLLQLSDGWIVIHLGMSGRLKILFDNTHKPEKHDHIDVCFQNGIVLRYTDPRRFGAWLWVDKLDECKLLAELGPEPLHEAFNADYLWTLTQKHKVKIKQFIMTNKIVVGVGNIYASESLFDAQILPYRPTNTLTFTEVEKLVASIKKIIQRAIIQGGTTLKDFLRPDGKAGYFVQELNVYKRAGFACPRCGAKVKSMIIGQRNSFFCEQCQQ